MINFPKLSVISAILTLAAGLPAQSFAESTGDGSLRIVGQISPFLSGAAGSGPDAPDYNDLFDAGFGGAVEYHRRLSERFSMIAGVGYESFSGETYQGIGFDDLERTSVYGGAKIHFANEQSDIQPYARLDIGAARISSVDVSYQELSGKYWDSSWSLLADAGAGVEKRFGDWSAYGEILIRYVDKPDSALGSVSDADGAWTLPIRIGVGYHF